jgi:hypothetical protein
VTFSLNKGLGRFLNFLDVLPSEENIQVYPALNAKGSLA